MYRAAPLPQKCCCRRSTITASVFRIGAAKNAVSANGQTIALPSGPYRRAVILAASVDGDRKAAFTIVKPAPVAWFASHRHSASGANEIYAYSYLFACEVELNGAKEITLPKDENIRVIGISVATGR